MALTCRLLPRVCQLLEPHLHVIHFISNVGPPGVAGPSVGHGENGCVGSTSDGERIGEGGRRRGKKVP